MTLEPNDYSDDIIIDLVDDPDEAPPQPPNCPHCGKPLDVAGDMTYCPYCETALEPASDDWPPEIVWLADGASGQQFPDPPPVDDAFELPADDAWLGEDDCGRGR
jgi:hypothetical protein